MWKSVPSLRGVSSFHQDLRGFKSTFSLLDQWFLLVHLPVNGSRISFDSRRCSLWKHQRRRFDSGCCSSYPEFWLQDGFRCISNVNYNQEAHRIHSILWWFWGCFFSFSMRVSVGTNSVSEKCGEVYFNLVEPSGWLAAISFLTWRITQVSSAHKLQICLFLVILNVYKWIQRLLSFLKPCGAFRDTPLSRVENENSRVCCETGRVVWAVRFSRL